MPRGEIMALVLCVFQCLIFQEDALYLTLSGFGLTFRPLLSPLHFILNLIQDYQENTVITQLCKTAGALNKITSPLKEVRVNFLKIENAISCIHTFQLFKKKTISDELQKNKTTPCWTFF